MASWLSGQGQQKRGQCGTFWWSELRSEVSSASLPDCIRQGKDKDEIDLLPGMANRHGLVAGATGTGKTVTLQTLAEQFSQRGVPVFMADVKGDLAGISQAGGGNDKVAARVKQLGLSGHQNRAYPVVFWDLLGEQGHPVRATVSEMGPLLLSRLLNLNDTQAGVLSIVFKAADDNGLLLLDLKDLRAMLQFVADHANEIQTHYGNVSAASVGAIQRGLLTIEQQGGDKFFGEPALNLQDLLQTGDDGRGVINVLAAEKLMQSPKLYATFLLWLLSELFEVMPEVGDPEKPVLVFFFDEAHLLFDDAAEGIAGQDRAGDPAGAEQGCGRLLRNAKSAGCAGYGFGSAGESGAACAKGVHAEGSEGGEGGGGNVPRESKASTCRQ